MFGGKCSWADDWTNFIFNPVSLRVTGPWRELTGLCMEPHVFYFINMPARIPTNTQTAFFKPYSAFAPGTLDFDGPLENFTQTGSDVVKVEVEVEHLTFIFKVEFCFGA